MDYIIVGGGISGLYLAYKLSKDVRFTNNKIILFESRDRFGGRIHTFNKKINGINYRWEAGAGRFNNNHKLLIELIKDLKLDKKINKISANNNFLPNKYYKNYTDNTTPYKYIREVIKLSKKNKTSDLRKYTFMELSIKLIGKKKSKFIYDSYGYYSELSVMNAYDAIHLFKIGMNPKHQFYSLNGGLSQIINKIVTLLKRSGIILKKKSIVTDISYSKNTNNFNVTVNNKKYSTLSLILAIPKPNLTKFKILNKIKKDLNSIKCEPLERIYAVYPKKNGKVWFDDLIKTTTNNKLRYLIPINKNNGTIMISYTDGIFTKYWHNLELKNDKELKNKINKHVNKLFSKKIDPPIYLKSHYWSCGAGYWKKNINSNIISKKIIKPFTNMNLYICGENYSLNQAWIEGALETSKDVINKLDQSTYTLSNLKTHKLKRNAWLIVDKNVYNVTNWIDKHPGGKIIMNGIGKDSTKIFKMIGHSKNAYSMLKKFKIGKLNSF